MGGFSDPLEIRGEREEGENTLKLRSRDGKKKGGFVEVQELSSKTTGH